ncbi:phosphate acetyltransferase [Xanthobacter tagetidis]|uniref:Phosphate acetyltransferase n=1 Tax=Xanthobacter tagetidis TaxID=60216 RepID=A0A3L7AHW4_9HYPH|nr:phosphate acetyltransferase [Xanthobacter tagetidis]MBB6306959.1 phosphate acetyltransferase [Xanthobacter tagetidis]RLP79979.1 phosphate acetyltransferase [Xanthobacter tagetidis]
MLALDRIIDAARAAPRAIVLPEGADPRIAAAARRAVREGIARPILLGPAAEVVAALGGDARGIAVEDPATSPRLQAYAEALHLLRHDKGMDLAAAHRRMREPLAFAAMMVRQGDADGTVGGAVATTAETVRAAIQIIGLAPEAKLVSSFFLMLLCEDHHVQKGAYVFADCGLVIDPDAAELADIARASAASFTAMTGERPKVAMLSFSTAGSARHARVDKVVEAVRIARAASPDLIIEGELQFDAAFVAAVGAAKAPGSAIRGDANVFVFPNLDAANIGYKIAQRIGGARAIGPVLQGLAKPANDLSRGCSEEDAFHMIALTCAQASARLAAGAAGEIRAAALPGAAGSAWSAAPAGLPPRAPLADPEARQPPA